MNLEEFHNALRVLRSIDSHELQDPEWYSQFRDNPYEFFVRCSSMSARLIWDVVLRRSGKKEHRVKCWPDYFKCIVEGTKTFDLRVNDRGYKVGDLITFMEWNPNAETYTRGSCLREISYVLPGGQFGLLAGWVALGLTEPESII